MERLKRRDGGFGRCRRGVVDVADAADGGDMLLAARDALEGGNCFCDRCARDSERAGGGDRGGSVFEVVFSEQVVCRSNRVTDCSNPVTTDGKPKHFAAGAFGKRATRRIIAVQHENVVRFLVFENLRFGVDVGSHRGIAIQVIRHDVGNDGHVRTLFDARKAFEVPTGKLEDNARSALCVLGSPSTSRGFAQGIKIVMS